jgi:hypothetical protein
VANSLKPNERLAIGQSLESPNGSFTLLMQTDANLVAYHGPVAVANAYFASQTWELPAEQRPQYLLMQTDGNCVLYDASGAARWSTGTYGEGLINPYFTLQDDGNLVVYHNGLVPIWACGRWPDKAGAIPARGHITPGQPEKPVFPIRTTQTDSFSTVGGHLTTDVTIFADGTLSASTAASEDTLLRGFRGGAVALLLDGQHNILWGSQTIEVGVDGSLIGTSKRIVNWTAQVPAAVLDQTRYVAVKQATADQDVAVVIKNWLDGINNLAPDLLSIAKLIALVAS